MDSYKPYKIFLIFLVFSLIVGCSNDNKTTSPSNQSHGIQYVGRCDTPDQSIGVIVSDGYAYVADHDSGMQIIDITDPAHPFIIGQYSCPGALQIDINNTIAYIADETLYSLEIVDISNPAEPEFIGRFDTLGVLGVKVSGDFAFIGCGSDGLNIVNISDPSNPFWAGSCVEIEVLRFELADQYILAPGGNGFDGLFTVNKTILSNPVVSGSVQTGGIPFEVAAINDYAYMTNLGGFGMTDTGYIFIIDISDPTSLLKVDSMSLGIHTVADFIVDDYLYVTFVNSETICGFHIMDISNPVLPEIIETQLFDAMPWDIWVEDSYIYVAADTAGLLIYSFNP